MYVGIDVSQARLDVAVSSELDRPWQVPYNPEGLAQLVQQLRALQPALIVVEASGGWQDELVGALRQAQLAVAGVNPRQVRDFAKASGRLAKTDRLDARVLAQFAQAMRPQPRPGPEESTQQLQVLVQRRQQLVEMRTAEKNRLARAPSRSTPASKHTYSGWSKNYAEGNQPRFSRGKRARS